MQASAVSEVAENDSLERSKIEEDYAVKMLQLEAQIEELQVKLQDQEQQLA